MNLVVDVCPKQHGIFFDSGDVEALVGIETMGIIRQLVRGSSDISGRCPSCLGQLRAFSLRYVGAYGCVQCGALWFNNEDLKAHVLDVRKRAYGVSSMAARSDVMRDASAFYAPEIAAGILAEFELEHEVQ